jgi:hypothetical protein
MDQPRTYEILEGGVDHMGRGYRMMPRRDKGFRGVVVFLIIPVDVIRKVEVPSPFVVASMNLQSIDVCRFRGNFLVELFFHYLIHLPHAVVPDNLGRTVD